MIILTLDSQHSLLAELIVDAKLWLRRPSSGFLAPGGKRLVADVPNMGSKIPSTEGPLLFFWSTPLGLRPPSAGGAPTSLLPRLLVSLRGRRFAPEPLPVDVVDVVAVVAV